MRHTSHIAVRVCSTIEHHAKHSLGGQSAAVREANRTMGTMHRSGLGARELQARGVGITMMIIYDARGGSVIGINGWDQEARLWTVSCFMIGVGG
jgi:hypothetical protein